MTAEFDGLQLPLSSLSLETGTDLSGPEVACGTGGTHETDQLAWAVLPPVTMMTEAVALWQRDNTIRDLWAIDAELRGWPACGEPGAPRWGLLIWSAGPKRTPLGFYRLFEDKQEAAEALQAYRKDYRQRPQDRQRRAELYPAPKPKYR